MHDLLGLSYRVLHDSSSPKLVCFTVSVLGDLLDQDLTAFCHFMARTYRYLLLATRRVPLPLVQWITFPFSVSRRSSPLPVLEIMSAKLRSHTRNV